MRQLAQAKQTSRLFSESRRFFCTAGREQRQGGHTLTARPNLSASCHGFSARPSRKAVWCQTLRLEQRRKTSFLHDNSTSVTTRNAIDTSRTPLSPSSVLIKGKRSKISTLAIDHLSRADTYDNDEANQPPRSNSKVLDQGLIDTTTSPRKSWRRTGLISAIVIVILFGGDLLRAILPGVFGVLLYVAGYVKSIVRWIKMQRDEPK